MAVDARWRDGRFRATGLITCLAVVLTGCSSATAGKPARPQPSALVAPTSSGSNSPAVTPASRGAAFVDAAAVRSVLADASRDVVSANTYDYRRLATFRRVALAATTGELTHTLAQTIDDLIVHNAPRLHSRQVAKVDRIGIADMHGADATVLIFGQLSVRSLTYPSGRTDPFDLVAGVRRVHGHWLLTRLATDGTVSCDPPGTADLATACANAAAGAAAITTFRRSTFERDFQRATAMLTGSLKADVRSQKQSTLRTLLHGKFDLRAQVLASAVESARPGQVEVLVALNGYRSTSTTPVPQHLVVTVENVQGRWLLSDVTNVGVS